MRDRFDIEVDLVHGVDSDLVVGKREGVLARLEPPSVPDECSRHRLAGRVDDVVIPGQHVLRELDVPGEPAIRERLIGVSKRRVLGVVLRPLTPAALAHREQHRKRPVRRLVHRAVGVGERREIRIDGSHDAPVEQKEPAAAVGDRA